MEIERKFLIKQLPDNVEGFCSVLIEQAYLCRKPVIRIRRADDEYILTYKGGGMMAREEYNLPLNETAYYSLLPKAEGTIIKKRRYRIPFTEAGRDFVIELDHFDSPKEGLWMAEVEFSSVEEAESFVGPDWFGEEVTYDKNYHNSNM